MNLLAVFLDNPKGESPLFEELSQLVTTEKFSDRHGRLSQIFVELRAESRPFEFSDRLSFEFERHEGDMIVMLNMLSDSSSRNPESRTKLYQCENQQSYLILTSKTPDGLIENHGIVLPSLQLH